MKNKLCFFLFSLFIIKTSAQYVEGLVLNAETKLPIENVNVYLDNLEQGTYTNSKGKYNLNFPFEKIENGFIHFSHVGYQTLAIPFEYKKKEYSVYLIPKVDSLSEIEIHQKRTLKPAINFTKVASMTNGIHAFGSILNDGKIYIVGGNASFEIDGPTKTLEKYENSNLTMVEILLKSQGSYELLSYKGDLITYDIELDTLEIEKSKFLNRANHNINLYQNNLYVLGGTMLSKNGKFQYLNDKIEVLNLTEQTVVEDATNPHQAVNFASFNYQDNLIVMGGSTRLNRNGFKTYSSKVHLYNLSSGYWYEIDSMPKEKEVSGILVKDKIYLLGGFANKPLTDIETYDLISKEWKKEGELFYGISNPAIATDNNFIYAYNEGKITTYNLLLNELNEYFIDLTISNCKMFYYHEKLYIVGGLIQTSYSKIPSTGIFSIDIHEFEKTNIHRSKKL